MRLAPNGQVTATTPHTHMHIATHTARERAGQIGVHGDLDRLDLGMTDFWSVCYTVHCAHNSHRPLCRAHPERAALLFLVPGRRGRGQGRWVGASADTDRCKGSQTWTGLGGMALAGLFAGCCCWAWP